MKIKTILSTFFLLLVFVFALQVQAQSLLSTPDDGVAVEDTVADTKPRYYKTAEISFEIENENRYIKSREKQIESYRNMAEIDSAFSRLSQHIEDEFNDFSRFNKANLSKFFLLNTKRVWLSYRSQLSNWQVEISQRINSLMEISNKVKEKEKMWETTSNQPGNKRLPEEINSRIMTSIEELNDLETKLYEVVGGLSVLDSRITDQIIAVDQHVEIIDELHRNYRINAFKATQPPIWNLHLKGSYEGSVPQRLKKAWYENTKSLRNSMPSLTDYLGKFIAWCLLIIALILSFRYLYRRQLPAKRLHDEKYISELIIRHPTMSILYMVLFVFVIIFNNIPLALSGVISLITLVITYFLLRAYISNKGNRLIATFVVLLAANILEIVFWYFGNYARLYLFLEAGLGMYLVSYFIGSKFRSEMFADFRYKRVVALLRYPVFSLYVVAFLVNIFGFQNLTVLFLKIGTQVSVSIIVIIGAWEISKSILYTFFEVLNHFKSHNSHEYFPLLKKRLTLFMGIFFGLVWFHSVLTIVELDTPFYDGLNALMNNDRHIGSFNFTYHALFQFVMIMLITWGLSSVIKILFDEGNFKKTQRLRGVPAAISTTLRLIVGFAGFFLALSGAGIDLTKISILIGAFGVGIGFGLQNIVNNFISGLILIYERPIQVGDTIEINTLMGEVKKIGIRSSNVRTYDGAEVVVPNSVLVSDQLINWTLSDDKRRIEIIVGVKYGTDPVKVIEILKRVAGEHELVAKDPEPRVLFNEFADSSLNFRLLFWVLFEHGIQTKSEVSVSIDKAFKEAGIEIPFPQLDLHVIDTPEEKEPTREPLPDPVDDQPLIADGSGVNDGDANSDEPK